MVLMGGGGRRVHLDPGQQGARLGLETHTRDHIHLGFTETLAGSPTQ